MSTRIATGLAESDAGVDSFAEAAGRAALGLGGARADLALVFAGAANLTHVEQGLTAVRDRLGARALIGCGAQGVIGTGRELEEGGVAVWAACIPDAAVETFHMEVLPLGEGQAALTGLPDLTSTGSMLLLVDPYSFPVEPVLDELAERHPGLPVIGGLSSAGGSGGAVLMHGGEVVSRGAVGVALEGIDVRPCVSQGARPIGPEMVITACQGNVIHELASRPALDRLKEAIASLEPHEAMLAARGLLLGIVIDENQPDYARGDFLIRGLLSVDEEEGTITVGEQVRVGQTVRMQVRDGESADQDLDHALDELRRVESDVAGALVFSCTGRGSHMFEQPDHDAQALERALAGAPAAGFFCAGEIGPVGARSFVHGFTATVAVFPA